jgi:repressor LexA
VTGFFVVLANLKVRGDRLHAEDIHDGDLIIYIESAKANNGDAVVALIDGDHATVKKFYREGKKIRLESANKDYSPSSFRRIV